MKLSVVIVNYNVKYFLEQCLHSVQKAAGGIETEIWVVDNNSVDGSVEMVREKFPSVKIIANTDNKGFSKANNQAIHLSTGDYVLLLNPDTVVEEDTFRKMLQFMDAHPDAGGLGVKMIDGTGKFLPESKRGLPTPTVAFYKIFGLSALFPKSKTFGKYHLGYLDQNAINPVDVLAGAFMLIRKDVLQKIGLLDEDFFMYGEDIDLSYRITKAGYKNYYFPDARIIHYKGESTKKSSVNYVFVFYNAMIIFAKKHFSKSNASLFYLFHTLCDLPESRSCAVDPFSKKNFTTGPGFFALVYWHVFPQRILGTKYDSKLSLRIHGTRCSGIFTHLDYFCILQRWLRFSYSIVESHPRNFYRNINHSRYLRFASGSLSFLKSPDFIGFCMGQHCHDPCPTFPKCSFFQKYCHGKCNTETITYRR
ncbi:MAG: glycosyltransferase family 2 protein [Bacteroidetes bacterium]|nr:glycosyltransferase family 2 protein [Bacteroidota bacterium]